jgi:hypothetical protein
MFDYIEKLRGKSERTKKFIAAGVAFLVAGIILLFWIFSIMPDFAQQQAITARVQSATPSPFGALSQILSQGTSGIGGEISKLKSASSGFFGATQIVNNATTTPLNGAAITTPSVVTTGTTTPAVSTTTNVIQ